MKNLILILVSLSLLTFVSCQKEAENCRDTRLGVYTGTISNTSGSATVTMTVNVGNSEKDVIIFMESPGASSFTLSGNLNLDCTVITIPEQTVTVSPSKYSGSLMSNGTTLKGTIYSDSYASNIDCTK